MILQRLAEHYDRIPELPRPGFSLQKVSFCVVLEEDGRLNSFQSLLRPEGRVLRPQLLVLPGQAKSSGSGLNPCFLWDNSKYLLGYSSVPEKQQRVLKAFEAFRQRHLELEQSIDNSAFSAVCSFLRSWSPERASEYAEELSSITTNFGVFRITGEMRYVHELVSLPGTGEESEREGDKRSMCLVSGAIEVCARLHEPKIKGVAGAQTSGALLVSFNAGAFTSYGKDQSYNAPVSANTVFRYANALNHLLDRSDRRTSLGDTTVVYWADHATLMADILGDLIGTAPAAAEELPPQEDLERVQQAQLLLSQIREGTTTTAIAPDGVPTKFFILGLSPNASRLSVRLWIEADAAELQRRLGQHIRDLHLKGGHDERPLSVWRLVSATGRAELDSKGKLKSFDAKTVSQQLAGDLARSVLTGVAYPQSLLATMVRRIRSDGETGFARISAIKACLVRNSRLRGAPMEVPVELDPNYSDIAYRCGRLFALLEKAQSDSAGGELNSTIKDRYFSSASTTPALVFPRLFRMNQHHLGKLETGSKIYYERLMASAMSAPFDFPRQLALADQGKFIVGYFQQRQDLYTRRKDKNNGENS